MARTGIVGPADRVPRPGLRPDAVDAREDDADAGPPLPQHAHRDEDAGQRVGALPQRGSAAPAEGQAAAAAHVSRTAGAFHCQQVDQKLTN